MISSREAYDYLVSVKCPLNIRHLALSISDKYCIDDKTTFEKRYDVVMLGRQNKVLQEFLNEYSERHKELTYVYGKKEGRNFRYYDQDGLDLGTMSSRDDYMNLMKMSRIGMYATPAMDGGRTDTNGFDQVTPRFLEYIVSGCHVLARYPKNSDTDYYELDKMSTRIDTYEQFEKAMDEMRYKEVDVARYAKYLANHYTSVRVHTLLKYLEEV